MKLTEEISASPIVVEKSTRIDEWRGVTSAKAGKIVPLAYVPLLREDAVYSGQYRVQVEMAETVKTLLNGVAVTVMAHFVPFLAFERFERSLDRFNRSYKNEPDKAGGSVVPFFNTITFDGTSAFNKTLGIHSAAGTINSAYVEAYNTLINFRYRARSTKLAQRTITDETLAACFWKASPFADVVPDFDQAMIDGEVTLNVVPPTFTDTQYPVKQLYVNNAAAASGQSRRIQPDGTVVTDYTDVAALYTKRTGTTASSTIDPMIHVDLTALQSELSGAGAVLSLSNLELAKKTAAFAAMRKRYAGLDDDAIIDLLMSGVRVPDQQMAQPMLLDKKSTVIGYTKRYATDAANLDTSVTTGVAGVDLRMRLPAMNTGGIILITCEIVPEQMFERMRDKFLDITNPDELPRFDRDYLDPEKVDVVLNKDVDVLHGTPAGVFGYAGLNRSWNRSAPHVGGRFKRGIGSAEDRQRIWTVEQTDPALTTDFYLATNLHHNVFADTLADPFEITTIGACEIVGNTVFGKRLEEDTGDYSAVLADVDQTRITQ